MKVSVVALCGFLLAAPAFAQTASTAANGGAGHSGPSQATENGGHNGDRAQGDQRQICRRMDSDMSRRIGSRLVCHTAQEWRELQDNN